MIRFFNGKVVTMDGDIAVTEQEVWTDGDRIAYVGPGKENAPAFEREIDLKGDVLLPGFKDAHAHSAMTFLRSFADDLPLQSWLFDKVFPLEARLTPDDIYALTKLAILEYVAGGITSAFDMYYKREAFARGIELSDFTAQPARLVLLEAGDGGSTADVMLTEGKFHQVKRMFAAVGHPLTALSRLGIGPLELDPGLGPGEWRHLTGDEARALRDMCAL